VENHQAQAYLPEWREESSSSAMILFKRFYGSPYKELMRILQKIGIGVRNWPNFYGNLIGFALGESFFAQLSGTHREVPVTGEATGLKAAGR
jgi:hypothetical protein